MKERMTDDELSREENGTNREDREKKNINWGIMEGVSV